VINMVPPDAAAAFSSNQVDAWAIWPPWGEQQVIAKTGRFLSGGEAHVQSVIVMRAAFMKGNIKTAQAVLRAVEQAKQWLQANPAEGVTLIAQELQLPETVVQAAWGKHDWSAQLNAQVIDDLAAKANFLLEQKMIQKPVAVADLVFPIKP
jgi:ABC-type nitrate/sulfonate/bicarbonate transport system substrate-binding protein